MQMWIGWHKFLLKLDNVGVYRYKLEDLSGENGGDRQVAVVQHIFGAIARPAPAPAFITKSISTLAEQDPDHHHRKHRPTLTWGELFRADEELAMQAWHLSAKFGYDYPDFDPSTFKPGAVPHC